MKVCSVCKTEQEENHFYKLKAGKNGLHPSCKTCVNKKNKKWKHENLLQYKYGVKNARLKKEYGITLEEYLDMLDEQQHSCAICNQKEKFSCSLAVDHCHKTGKVRGLLCRRCNQTLGLLEENPLLLKNMQKYLKNTEN